jgi:hypothetical protein
MERLRRLWNGRFRFAVPRALRLARPALFFSASELGEDKALEDILEGIPDRFYIDVGCWDPFAASDTYALYRKGWRGLVIDADGRFAKAYRRIRPRDIFVEALVTSNGRDVDFVDSNGTSSASARWQQLFPGKASRRPSLKIQDLLDKVLPEETAVGLLKVDVESLDTEVLLAIDVARLRPYAIMVELHVHWTDEVAKHGVSRHLETLGYRAIYHNRRNVVFVDEARFAKARPDLAVVYAAANEESKKALDLFTPRRP